MKKGDIVKIYQEPITKQQPEGEAKLLKRLDENEYESNTEKWEVRFLSDG